MSNISVTNTFVNGQSADAGEVNTNFTDVINGTSDGSKDFSVSALTVAGVGTFNGNVVLGNGSGDTITVTGTATFAETTTFTGATVHNGAVTLGNASGDDITITGSIAASIPIKTGL